MNRIAIFTIVSKNYVGLASVLMQSIKEADKNNYALHICVADEPEDNFPTPEGEAKLIFCKNEVIQNNALWHAAAFKYNIIEFCTFLKPYCFNYLFAQYDKVIYFDPDILVAGELTYIINRLDNHSVVLTPHITRPVPESTELFTDRSFAKNGIFNLGFIACKKDTITKDLINWWSTKVTSEGYKEYSEGLATDQKWMDFAPAFLGTNLYILREKGYNVAPWNFQENELKTEQGIFYVKDRGTMDSSVTPLVFTHFSGFNYKDLFEKNSSTYRKTIDQQYPDFLPLFEKYQKKLQGNFSKYADYKYAYATFKNGKPILPIHRRWYRHLSSMYDIMDKDPFQTNSIIYQLLQSNKILFNPGKLFKQLSPLPKAVFLKKGFLKGTASFFIRLAVSILGPGKYSKMVNLFSKLGKFENHIYVIYPND